MKKKIFIVTVFLLLFLCSSFCYGANVQISAPSAILVDTHTGKILYEKNANEKMYPASTTKMLTAIIAIENCNLQDVVTISDYAVSSIPSSYAGLKLEIGEKLTVEQLLNVLLIASSNIAGNALAEHISGNINDFAVLMNNKSAEIGCKNSNFVNPYGLHDDNHYTTAYDLCLIARYGMQNDIFKEIVAKKSYTIPATNKNSNSRTVYSTNELLNTPDNKTTSFIYPYATGVKTGFTGPAKECLVASANKNNFEIISVVLGANTNDLKYVDTTKLFDFAYDNYEYGAITNEEIPVASTVIKNAKEENKTLDLYAENEIYTLIEKNVDLNFVPEINLKDNLKAPIQINDVVGTVSYEIDGNRYTTNLVAKENVEKASVFRQLIRFISNLFS